MSVTDQRETHDVGVGGEGGAGLERPGGSTCDSSHWLGLTDCRVRSWWWCAGGGPVCRVVLLQPG